VPGRVKTRLAREIGDACAARAYVSMARQVRAGVAALGGVRVVWVYEPARRYRDLAWLDRPPGELRRQARGDIGARMSAAFERAFEEGAASVCAIGGDSPDLPARLLPGAFGALERRDLVLGPSEDGGYYLIGLRRPCRALFEGIPWSGARVLAATRERARSSGLSLEETPRHYDVDTAAGLVRWLGA